MAAVVPEWVAARAASLFFYSPYNFLRQVPADIQQELFGVGLAARFGTGSSHRIFSWPEEQPRVQFLYSFLAWDTEFFGTPFFKLFTALFATDTPVELLADAAQAFQRHLHESGPYYCFVDLPAEDTRLAQALGLANWRTVETRLHYYHDALATFSEPRYPVRAAQPVEASLLGQVAAQARNPYDRFHADSWFGEARADAFLAAYATAAVQGYCDVVLVPDIEAEQPDSFIALSDLKPHATALGCGLSRVVLSAVGPINRGWHLKLVSETLHRARNLGASYVLMTTQATNRAVFRTCEKLMFKLGASSHIFACSHQTRG